MTEEMETESVDQDQPPVPNDTPSNIVGGFTLLHDRTKRKKPIVEAVLPYWMSHCTPIQDSLVLTKSVKEIPELSKAMRKKLKKAGFKKLFPVQYEVIPAILQSYNYTFNFPRPRDICVSAPTGSGKTLAYVIPIVQLLLNRKVPAVRALVVLPGRDLARQVFSVFNNFITDTDLEVALLIGEKTMVQEQSSLVKLVDDRLQPRADIVVCTPGRLVDHLRNTDGFNLLTLRILVVDEADRVIAEEKQSWFTILDRCIYRGVSESGHDQTFSPDEETCHKRPRPLPNLACQMNAHQGLTLQKILLSATLTHDPEPLKHFHLAFPRLFAVNTPSSLPLLTTPTPKAQVLPLRESTTPQKKKAVVEKVKDGVKDATVTVKEEDMDHSGIGRFSTPAGLKESFVILRPDQKPLFLVHLVRTMGHKSILCFTNSREDTHRLSLLLSGFSGITVAEISARLPLQKRQRILNQFRQGELTIIVCSDSMARGMDVDNVSCVVSYDKPVQIKTYIHRIGRTARAGKFGVAYSIIQKNQAFYFKKELMAVGKGHIKETKLNSSAFRKFSADYRKALQHLAQSVEKEQQANSETDVVVKKEDDAHSDSSSEDDTSQKSDKDKNKKLRKKNHK